MIAPGPRLAAAIAASLVLATACARPTPTGAPQSDLTFEKDAGAWTPLVIEDAASFRPAPPPAFDSAEARAERDELKRLQAQRTDDDRKAIAYWNEHAAPIPWSELTDQTLIDSKWVPPRAARALAVVHAAMFDATVAAWNAKAHYKRALPRQVESSLSPLAGDDAIPSYPSEHAAVAGAAAATLAYLFPEQAADFKTKAQAAAETRVRAGANYRSDVTAGLALGEAVARRIIARADVDGYAGSPATASIAATATTWGNPAAMTPTAGTWKTWLLESGSQFRLPMPDALDTPVMQDELAEVGREVDSLSRYPWKLSQATYWNFDVPAIIWDKTAKRLLKEKHASTPQAARTLAVLGTLEADTFIALWDTKYVVLRKRPAHMDPTLQAKMPFATPPHPSYPSGHSGASMAAATYLAGVFPDYAMDLYDDANQAAMSRLYAGIHYPSDNADGLKMGKQIADYALQKLKNRGTL
ncbi:PAP2 superfamily protein [compost metagenome]